MKVALVLDRFDPRLGGLEHAAYQLATWLLKTGHEVHIVAFDAGADFRLENLTIHRLDQPWSRLKRAGVVEQYLRGMDLNVIHDMGTGWYFDVLQPGFGSRIAGLRQDLMSFPAWQRVGQRLSPSRNLRYRQLRVLEQRQYSGDRGIVIAVSQMVQTHLQTLHQVAPERIRLVYNGVDSRRYSPEHRSRYREVIRAGLGLKREILFLFVAHNFRLKGLVTALEAMRVLVAAGCPVHLAVVGRGLVGYFQRISSRLGISHRVTFCGPADDTVPYYAAADVFVHPTFYDPCSLVALEAWACGLPVITSRFNGAAELMIPGQEGFIIDDPGDARELAEKMEASLDDSLRLRMADAARALALKHSTERYFEILMELYHQSAGRR